MYKRQYLPVAKRSGGTTQREGVEKVECKARSEGVVSCSKQCWRSPGGVTHNYSQLPFLSQLHLDEEFDPVGMYTDV